MKEIKQYLVVYWTLTTPYGILRNFVLKQNKQETSILLKQNLEEKWSKKQRKQIRLDSKFLFILPRSTRSPKQTKKKKKKQTEEFTLTNKLNQTQSPLLQIESKTKAVRDCQTIPPPPADELRVVWQNTIAVNLLLHGRHFFSFDDAKTLKHTRKPPPRRKQRNRWLKTQRTVTHNLQSVNKEKWNGTLQNLMYNKVENKVKKHFFKRNYKKRRKKYTIRKHMWKKR